MNKIHLLYGVLIGVAACLLGSALFILFFTEYGVSQGFLRMKQQGALGKLLALGAILDVAVFFILLRLKKELMARGIVLALILISIYTLLT